MMCMNLHGDAMLSCLHRQAERIENSHFSGPDTKEQR